MNAFIYDSDGTIFVRKPNGLEYNYENVDKPAFEFEYDVVIYDDIEVKIERWEDGLGFDQQKKVALSKEECEIIEQYIEQPISIFSFEKKWYLENKINVEFFGHPLIDNQHFNEDSKSFFLRHQLTIEHPILLLLPGSRRQEIEKHWPIYLEVAKKLRKQNPNMQFILGKTKGIKIKNIPNFIKIEENAKKAMVVSTAGAVASGTATLECAVEELPMVVCYKMSSLSWLLAKLLVDLKFSSIVNIIANKKIVPELLQSQMDSKNLMSELEPLLNVKNNKRSQMVKEFQPIKELLGQPGVYNRVASAIIEKMKDNE